MADGSLKLDSVCDPNVTGVEKSGAIQITEAVVFPGSHMFILMFEVSHVRLFFSEVIFFSRTFGETFLSDFNACVGSNHTRTLEISEQSTGWSFLISRVCEKQVSCCYLLLYILFLVGWPLAVCFSPCWLKGITRRTQHCQKRCQQINYFLFFSEGVQTGAFYNWNLTKRKQVISETNGILKDVVIFKYSVHHLGRHVDHYLLSAYMARYRVGWRVETSPVWQLSALFSQTRIDPPNETLFRKKLVDTQTMLL